MNQEALDGVGPAEFNWSLDGFDVNAAFQGALSDVISDEELTLTEKVSRTEAILEVGQSEIYRAFVDFRALAAQINDCSSHDHAMDQGMKSNETINGFLAKHEEADEHHHSEKDKKKKRRWLRRGWLRYFINS